MRTPVIAVPDNEIGIVSSSAARFGVLMAGPKFIEWPLVGEMAVGHIQMDRRDLTAFVNINVGRRNESEAAINDGSERLHMDWYKNPDRIVTKTARDCANDVRQTFGDMFGFVVPEILIGLAPERAEELFDKVLPAEIREQSLVEVTKHLNSTGFTDMQEEKLRGQLLYGANTAFANLTKYVVALESEMGLARDKGTGKKGPDPVEVEYFRELGRPLPAEVPAMATLAMGKEIAANMKSGGNNDELIKIVLEQNQILMDQFKKSQQAQAQETITEPAPTKRAADKNKDK